MATINPYLKQYKKNQIDTATPEQILIMLYDGAINFLNRAKIALEENNDEQFHKGIMGCKRIIVEFMETLDMEQGGKFVATLYSLYKYLRKILVKADITKNADAIDEVLRHLTRLRETWQKAIEIVHAERELNLNEKNADKPDVEEHYDYAEEDENYDEDDDEEEEE